MHSAQGSDYFIIISTSCAVLHCTRVDQWEVWGNSRVSSDPDWFFLIQTGSSWGSELLEAPGLVLCFRLDRRTCWISEWKDERQEGWKVVSVPSFFSLLVGHQHATGSLNLLMPVRLHHCQHCCASNQESPLLCCWLQTTGPAQDGSAHQGYLGPQRRRRFWPSRTSTPTKAHINSKKKKLGKKEWWLNITHHLTGSTNIFSHFMTTPLYPTSHEFLDGQNQATSDLWIQSKYRFWVACNILHKQTQVFKTN